MTVEEAYLPVSQDISLSLPENCTLSQTRVRYQHGPGEQVQSLHRRKKLINLKKMQDYNFTSI